MILLLFVLCLGTSFLYPMGGKPESPTDRGSYDKAREEMVANQIVARGIKDPKVLNAMRKVPRHHFVPEELRKHAYDDTPLPIGYGQTISQPYIVAYMTELLQLRDKSRVLEIGTGSGYQAAVLGEITPHVFSIEIIPQLGERARKALDGGGYGFVKTKIGDGYYGWEEEAPFDGILVTAAAGHVPIPLLSQLKPGGRIVIPIGGVYEVQMLTLVEKKEDGSFKTSQLIPVRFVPFTRTGGKR